MADTTTKKIAIIVASVRTPRVGPQVVEVIHEIIKKSPVYASTAITVVDIASFNLPIFDEKVAPATLTSPETQFEHEHSRKWSAAIAPYDGYIFVSPEYNGGVPGAAKNAVDYLFKEWTGKPMFIITYGIFGGSSSSLAWRDTFEVMRMRVLPTRPQLKWSGGGHGPDSMAAVTQGTLGEATRKDWPENTEVVQGFEELLDFVRNKERQGTRVVLDRLGL